MLWKCTVCGKFTIWKPNWFYIRKNYEDMIAKGLADPEIADGRIFKIKRNPKYLHPPCPYCGGRMNWFFARGSRAQIAYIFKGKLLPI